LGTSEENLQIYEEREDTIFVFKKSSGSLNFGDAKNSKHKGVVVQLEWIKQRFWALNGEVRWNQVSGSHR